MGENDLLIGENLRVNQPHALGKRFCSFVRLNQLNFIRMIVSRPQIEFFHVENESDPAIMGVAGSLLMFKNWLQQLKVNGSSIHSESRFFDDFGQCRMSM